MKHVQFLIFAVILLAACGSPSQTGFDEFSEVVEVTAYDSLFSDKGGELMGTVSGMEIKNGLLVLAHSSDEYRYSFVDARSGRLLKRWGKTGQGPDEFATFGMGFVLGDSLLSFMGNRTLNYVSVPDILSGRQPVGKTVAPCPYTVDFRPFSYHEAGGYKVFTGAFANGYLGVLGPDNAIVPQAFDYPFSTDPLEGIFRGSVYQGMVRANGARHRFVSILFRSDVFEIYEWGDGGICKVCTSPFRHVPQVMQRGTRYGLDGKNSIGGLRRVAVSDKWVCFQYSPEKGTLSETYRDIYCYDWDGNKVKKYVLPFPVGLFCVDDEYLYAVRERDDYSVVCRFKL